MARGMVKILGRAVPRLRIQHFPDFSARQYRGTALRRFPLFDGFLGPRRYEIAS
jgi:hypothetical protein